MNARDIEPFAQCSMALFAPACLRSRFSIDAVTYMDHLVKQRTSKPFVQNDIALRAFFTFSTYSVHALKQRHSSACTQ